MAKIPSQERLLALLEYDPTTGVIAWRRREWIDRRGRAKAFRHGGKIAGHQRRDGKRVLSVDGHLLLAHRVIWKLVTGQEPDCIDHINGDCTDNRFHNLRNCSQADNNRNVARRSDNLSGHSGVRFRTERGCWIAVLAGKWIGSFGTKEEALEARRKAQAAEGFTERHGK